MYHTEMGSVGDPYAKDEKAELVSDEDDFDLDQPLMSKYSFATHCSRPTTRSIFMELFICLSDHFYNQLFPVNDVYGAKLVPTLIN